MAGACFFDASAAVKAYFEEEGSERVEELLEDSGSEVYLSRVGPVEVAAATYRKVAAGDLEAEEASLAVEQLRSDVDSVYHLVEVGAVVAERAMRVAERHRLRGYDCLQLACALLLNEHRADSGLGPLTLLSSDGDLNEAAAKESIIVEDPTG